MSQCSLSDSKKGFSSPKIRTVGVKLEGDLDLRDATRSWWYAGEVELAEKVVVFCHGTFTFEDLDQDDGLVVCRCGEDLRLARWNGGTSWDQLGPEEAGVSLAYSKWDIEVFHLHDTTGRFNTESQWIHVHENDLCRTLSAGENPALNSSSESHSLIGVYAFAERLSEEFLQH